MSHTPGPWSVDFMKRMGIEASHILEVSENIAYHAESMGRLLSLIELTLQGSKLSVFYGYHHSEMAEHLERICVVLSVLQGSIKRHFKEAVSE